MLGAVENDVRASATPRSRAARKAHAAQRWAELRDRLASTTPQDLARAVLATAVVGGTAAITVATWPTLLPFVVGGLIAYLLLPVVDSLDNVIGAIRDSGALELTRAKALGYADSARSGLRALPPSPARDALETLAHYAVDRTY